MGLTKGELGDYFLSLGEKEYRATQIIKWVHQKGVSDISKMTDLSLELRERLVKECEIRVQEVIYQADYMDDHPHHYSQTNFQKRLEYHYRTHHHHLPM